jgi:enamine deaminase RidA (YjgF/YER057c/UK114 family)
MEDTNTESLECTDFYEQAYNVLQNIENSLTEITKEKPGLRYEETVSIALFKNKSCIIELGNRCKQTTMYKSVG